MRANYAALLVVAAGSWQCGTRTLDGGPSDASLDVADVTDVADATDAQDFSSCTGPGTCLLVPRSCCGGCGAATPADMIGVASTEASAYRSSVCEGSGCPACYQEQDPFLVALCDAGRCRATNLHLDAWTACTTDAECQLRYASCCEPCGAPTTGLVALRTESLSAYRAAVCAPTSTCRLCPTGYPPGYRAYCDPTSHCAVAPAR